MEIVNKVLRKTGKSMYTAIRAIIVITVIFVIFGFIKDRQFTLQYVFTGNYAASLLVLAAGLTYRYIPEESSARIRRSKLRKYVNFKEAPDEVVDYRAPKDNSVLYLGLAMAVFTGIFEILVWEITRRA